MEFQVDGKATGSTILIYFARMFESDGSRLDYSLPAPSLEAQMKACLRVFAGIVLTLTTVPSGSSAQSTAASVFGTVRDQQHAVITGASIGLRNLDTGLTRQAMTDSTGNFRVIGLPPGRYEVRVERADFAPFVDRALQLSISQEAILDVMLKIASVIEATTVVAGPPASDLSTTSIGRTFFTKDIDELPVAARDFNSLALLTPGILVDHSTGRNPDLTISGSGQIGRNNTFLIDGLTDDDHVGGLMKGGVSLDSVKEFMVAANNFSAEYGQASGAIVSVLTRSGTNRAAGRVYYFHRDDRWDATDGAAKLAVPPADKTELEAKVVGSFVGGPLVRDRAFYFGSTEYTTRDTESVVTSSVLKTFKPNASPIVPEQFREPQLLGRADFNLNSRNVLTFRYRFDRIHETNRTSDPGAVGLIAPERRHDSTRRDQDFAVTDNHVVGSSGLNEFRFQFARRELDSDATKYCSGCPAENRQGILLGKSPVVPAWQIQNRWQIVNAFTWLVPDKGGDHAYKAGLDVSLLDGALFGLGGGDGIWRFTGSDSNRPFDATDPATYPFQYIRFVGEPHSHLNSRLYSLYVQDQWKPLSNVTFNLGLRWDYEDAVGASQDKDNVAPRLGVAVDPWRAGRTVIRGGYGVYYDAVLYRALNNMETGSQITQIIIQNPGYPDPYAREGRRILPPSVNRFAANIRTPYTEQATAGVRHMSGRMVASADWVWARGHNLLRTRDINYPDLTRESRPRPDPNFQRIRVRETEGQSWYRALLVGVQKMHAANHSYGIAYTFSRSERDTEDWEFFAADQRDYDAERGPSSSDVRHRLSANVNVDLPFGARLTTILTAQSGLPYNITTGGDDNRDGEPSTDRPSGVGRNSGRESGFWQLDARVAKIVGSGQRQVELLAEAFNLTNGRHWTRFDGNRSNATFGKPTDAGSPRQVQLGVRVSF